MRKITVPVASVLINASTILGLAAESTSNKDVDPTLPVSATLHRKPVNATDSEKTCLAYAASFHEVRDAATSGCWPRRRRAGVNRARFRD